VKVNSLPPKIINNERYAIDKGYLTDLCKFMTLMMYIPRMDGVECDVDVDTDVVFEGGPSDGAHPRIIVFMGLALWKYFMLKKDLNP